MTDESPLDDDRDQGDADSVFNEVREPTDAFVPATEESESSSEASEREGETGGVVDEDDVSEAVGEVNELREPTDTFKPATEMSEGGDDSEDGGGAGE
jgi:hypothetical protein